MWLGDSDEGDNNKSIMNFWSQLADETLTLFFGERVLQLKIALQVVFRVFDTPEYYELVGLLILIKNNNVWDLVVNSTQPRELRVVHFIDEPNVYLRGLDDIFVETLAQVICTKF